MRSASLFEHPANDSNVAEYPKKRGRRSRARSRAASRNIDAGVRPMPCTRSTFTADGTQTRCKVCAGACAAGVRAFAEI